MIPVVQLLRVSTESQASLDRAGLDSQRDTNRRTCLSFGLEIIETVEIVESGADVAQSPGMARVLAEVTSGRARGVLLAEYSRLFRPDRWSDLIVLQTISDSGARIYLPTGPIDLQSELGFVQATINNLLAAMERRRIRERMDRGKEEHRRRGRHVAGGLGIPFGVSWSEAVGWGYTAESAIVRELFRRFLAGERNLAGLGRELGIPRTSVKFYLENPIYCGWRVYDTRRQSRGGKRVPRRPEDVIRVKLPIEPLVSEGDFNLVQMLLAESYQPRPSRTDVFLYRGLLRCECGQPIYTITSGAHRPFYYCRTNGRARQTSPAPKCGNGYLERGRMERLLDEAIRDKLTHPDVMLSAIADYHASLEASWRTTPVDRVSVDERLAQLRGKKDRIVEGYFEGLISRVDRDKRLAQLADEISTAERMLERAEPEMPGSITGDAVAALAGAFAEWPRVDRAARRRLLEVLSPRFVVRKYAVVGVRFPIGVVVPERGFGNRWKTADAGTIPVGYTPAGSLYVPLCA